MAYYPEVAGALSRSIRDFSRRSRIGGDGDGDGGDTRTRADTQPAASAAAKSGTVDRGRRELSVLNEKESDGRRRPPTGSCTRSFRPFLCSTVVY